MNNNSIVNLTSKYKNEYEKLRAWRICTEHVNYSVFIIINKKSIYLKIEQIKLW